MCDYEVRYVPDEMLGGRDFLMLSEHSNGVTLFLRQGIRSLPNAANQKVLESAWAAFNKLAQVKEIPAQRQPAYSH